MISRTAIVTVFLLALLIPVRPASAQVAIEVAPNLGLYLPLGSYEGPNPLGFPPISTGSDWSQSNAVALGINASAWFQLQWGIGIGYHYMGSEVTATVGGIEAGRFDAHIQVVTAEAMARLGNPYQGFQIVLSGGAAYVTHGGAVFDGLEGQNVLGGVIGVGSRRPLGSKLAIAGQVRLLVYPMELRDQSATFKGGTQTDVLGQVMLIYRIR